MSETNKPREFCVPLNTLIINSCFKREPKGLHVIEYSAYEKLKGDPLVDVYALNNQLRQLAKDQQEQLRILREALELSASSSQFKEGDYGYQFILLAREALTQADALNKT